MEHNFTIVREKRGATGKLPLASRAWDVEVVDATLWPPAADAGAASSDLGIPPESIEASLLPRSRRLSPDFPVAGLGRPYLMHLEQRIARNPRDLEAHVRRVYQARALKDRAVIASALTDLFAVLDRRGRPLRSRLLAMVRDQLDPSQQALFAAALKTGFSHVRLSENSPQSRLLNRIGGTRNIVVRRNSENAEPVALARGLIDRDRIDAACALLEGLLSFDPGDADVSDTLLDLYERRDLRDRFFRTSAELLSRKVARAERWAELAAKFRVPAAADE